MKQRIVTAAVITLMLAGASLQAQEELLWRQVDPENLVYMELPGGTVTIELNPLFAPKTV